MMKKFLSIICCCFMVNFMLHSVAFAQESVGDKIGDAAHDTSQGVKHAAHAVGDGVKSGAHAVAHVAKSAKNQVILRCRNGRHALRRPGACRKAGGVVKQ
jgi:hypothetical protein